MGKDQQEADSVLDVRPEVIAARLDHVALCGKRGSEILCLDEI